MIRNYCCRTWTRRAYLTRYQVGLHVPTTCYLVYYTNIPGTIPFSTDYGKISDLQSDILLVAKSSFSGFSIHRTASVVPLPKGNESNKSSLASLAAGEQYRFFLWSSLPSCFVNIHGRINPPALIQQSSHHHYPAPPRQKVLIWLFNTAVISLVFKVSS